MPFLQRRTIVFFLTVTGSVVVVVAKKNVLRVIASFFCELLSVKPQIESDLTRDAFTYTDVDPVPPVTGHTHASAASLRTAATNFIRNMATYCGVGVFVVGMSKSDQRKDMKGTRQWYWAKDVNADNRYDAPDKDDIRYMCDVDYYVDMNRVLTTEVKPMVLYTMVPECASSSGVDETAFHFNEDGTLETTVAGGGHYRHYLWNYGTDSLLVSNWSWSLPFFRKVAYAVERKQVGKHRQLILLTPIRVFDGIAALLAHFLLTGVAVERFNPITIASDGSLFVRFKVHSKQGLCVTTARPSSYVCATVPIEVDDSIATVSRLGTTNLMLPTSASWIKDDRAAAAVLTEYHRLSRPKYQLTVFPVDLSVRGYQYNPQEYNQDAKPKLEAYMPPFVHGAFAPIPNKAGEERMVEGRINGLKKPEPLSCRFRDQCIEEFATFIVQGAVLEPLGVEVVVEKQTRPAQKLSLLKAVVNGDYRCRVLKCFIKAEAYVDVKDPRNISTYNDADKLDMAMFALSLAEHCKKFKWYGPGKTPIEIADRVAEICLNAEFMNVSDLHRMDGTISYKLRQVERAVCMKAFAHHRTELNELLKRNVDNKGYLPNGTTFDQGSSHGSGCSATSLFQTLRAAFAAYLGFRRSGSTPEGSFESLGIHLGDDGLDANLSTDAHLWACRRVGLVLEAGVVYRGQRGVNFLARYYSSEVWYGRTDSMCDPRRQLSKFHTTVRLPSNVTPEQKLVEKAMSYVATDGSTPIIGEFCKRVLVCSSFRPRTPFGVGSWWSKFDESVQYPNTNVDGWMDVEFAELFPEFDRSLFSEWLAKSSTISQLLQPPLCAEPKPATKTVCPVVVDQDVVSARESEGSCKSETSQKRPRRRANKKGDGKGGIKSPSPTKRMNRK